MHDTDIRKLLRKGVKLDIDQLMEESIKKMQAYKESLKDRGRPSIYSHDQKIEIIKMWAEGYTLVNIFLHFGIGSGPAVIRNILKRAEALGVLNYSERRIVGPFHLLKPGYR